MPGKLFCALLVATLRLPQAPQMLRGSFLLGAWLPPIIGLLCQERNWTRSCSCVRMPWWPTLTLDGSDLAIFCTYIFHKTWVIMEKYTLEINKWNNSMQKNSPGNCRIKPEVLASNILVFEWHSLKLICKRGFSKVRDFWCKYILLYEKTPLFL